MFLHRRNIGDRLRRIELHVGLRRTRRKLEEAVAEKNRLIEVIAHDLKNPLGSVLFAARFIQEREAGGRSGELMEIICDAAKRALGIVESLLEERGREHARGKMQIEWLPLDEVAASVREAFPRWASEELADATVALLVQRGELEPIDGYFAVVGVGVEVPEEVGEELEGVPDDEAGEETGVSVDDEFEEPSFFSPGVFSLGAAASLPAGGLSLSE